MAKELELPPIPKIHRWIRPLNVLVTPLMWILGPIVSTNRHQVPKEGGLIVLANHISDSDPVVLQYACPRAIEFMSKSELFDMKGVRWVLKLWGCFPVKRGEPDRQALRYASELAKSGRVVGIYPEGQLSEDAQLQEIRAGAALIIRMAGVPVICAGVKNANRIVPYGSMIPRPSFRKVTVNWGEPRLFDKNASTEEIVSWAEAELRRLIPEPLDVNP